MSKGADPVHHRVVLDTAAEADRRLDVDFADPSGKVFKSTYFEFDLARDGGYFEAGEYLVTLVGRRRRHRAPRRSSSLKGDNPPVYRGAMDFTFDAKDGKKKGPKIEAVEQRPRRRRAEVAPERRRRRQRPHVDATWRPSAPAPDMVPEGRVQQDVRRRGREGPPERLRLRRRGADGGSRGRAGCSARRWSRLRRAALPRRAVERSACDARGGDRAGQKRASCFRSTSSPATSGSCATRSCASCARRRSAGGVAAFNEDKFTAGEVDVEDDRRRGAHGADDGADGASCSSAGPSAGTRRRRDERRRSIASPSTRRPRSTRRAW